MNTNSSLIFALVVLVLLVVIYCVYSKRTTKSGFTSQHAGFTVGQVDCNEGDAGCCPPSTSWYGPNQSCGYSGAAQFPTNPPSTASCCCDWGKIYNGTACVPDTTPPTLPTCINTGCAAGLVCTSSGACANPNTCPTVPCGAGQVCNSSGVCVDQYTCTPTNLNGTCVSGSMCVQTGTNQGTCQVSCSPSTPNGVCASGSMCVQSGANQGTCQVSCSPSTPNGVCASGSMCVQSGANQGTCQVSCSPSTTNGVCASGYCSPSGNCGPCTVTGASNPNPCPSGTSCFNGSCVTTCTDSPSCNIGATCTDTGTCNGGTSTSPQVNLCVTVPGASAQSISTGAEATCMPVPVDGISNIGGPMNYRGERWLAINKYMPVPSSNMYTTPEGGEAYTASGYPTTTNDWSGGCANYGIDGVSCNSVMNQPGQVSSGDPTGFFYDSSILTPDTTNGGYFTVVRYGS